MPAMFAFLPTRFSPSSLLLAVLLALCSGLVHRAHARSDVAPPSIGMLHAEDLTLAVDTPGTGVNNITLKISEVAVFSPTSMRVYGFRNDTTGVLLGAMSPQVYWWIDGPTTIACSSGLPGGSFGGTLTTEQRTALMDEDQYLVLTWDASLGEIGAETFNLHFRICTSDPDTRGLSTTTIAVYTNDVTTTAYRKPVADSTAAQVADLRISRAFADGLGRAILAVDIAASPDSTDLFSLTAYDSLGQVSRQHLAFVADTTGNLAFQKDALAQQQAFWANPPDPDVVANPTPFAEIRHEASPLRRPLEAGAAAPAWQLDATETHTVRTRYYTNDADDLYLRWAEDSLVVQGGVVPDSVVGTVLRTGAAYAPATLYRTVTIDPNGDSTAVVTDGEGREVMKEAYLDGGRPVRTYYVYDHFGQLRYVVPPLATLALGDTLSGSGGDWSATHTTVSKRADAAFRAKYFTEYRYDAYGRQVEKKLPEEEVVTTIYDRLGRVVLQQDGVFRPDSLWYFTKYDPFGRVILTGTWTDALNRDRAQMQAHVDTTITGTKDAGAGTYAYYETRTGSTEHGYTEDAAFPPESESTVWTVSYFDDYDFSFNSGSPQFVQDYAATGSDAGQHYIAPFAATDRVLDQATGGKVLLPGAPGVYEQSHYGAGFVPAEPDTVYLLNAPSGGTITLGPGFSTNNGQHVEIGPVTPEGTAQTARYLETVTYYDRWGRAIQSQSTNHLGGVDRTSTQYSHDGLALAATTVHQTPHDTVTVSSRSEYDHTGRLLRTYQQHDTQAEVLVAQLHYNALGEVMQKDLHSDDGGTSFTKSVHYDYHVRGWLTEVDIPGLWRFRLSYDAAPGEDGYGNMGFTARYDGAVAAQTWRTDFTSAGDQSGYDNGYGYAYQYDGLGRLAKGQFGSNPYDPVVIQQAVWQSELGYTVDSLRYDRNGNIERLRRRDDQGVAVDDLSYTYDVANAPNRLLSVSDASLDTTAMYFRAASTCSFGSQYQYDGNGSMVVDPHKCISIEYNYKNLPVEVKWEDGRRIEWTYDATGAKLRKRVLDAFGSVVSQLDYVGGFVYRSDGGTSPRLAFYGQPEGRVVVDETGGAFFEYVISDHLGNSRVVLHENGSVVQEDHYYPFGLKLAGLVSSSTSEPHQYTYNGKELEDEHELWWYHYGVRYYDPQVARWHAIDPADQFYTPYTYVGNDPINLVDPDGAQAETIIDRIQALFSFDMFSDSEYDDVNVLGSAVASTDPQNGERLRSTIKEEADNVSFLAGVGIVGLSVATVACPKCSVVTVPTMEGLGGAALLSSAVSLGASAWQFVEDEISLGEFAIDGFEAATNTAAYGSVVKGVTFPGLHQTNSIRGHGRFYMRNSWMQRRYGISTNLGTRFGLQIQAATYGLTAASSMFITSNLGISGGLSRLISHPPTSPQSDYWEY